MIAEVTDDDWARPTTCEDFTVRQLVDHAMHWQAMGGGVIGAGTEPGAAWDDVRPAVAAALEDPANLEGNAEAFGNMPKQQVLGLLITDLLVHSWDLARSIGADETLPPDAVAAASMGLRRMPEEMLARRHDVRPGSRRARRCERSGQAARVCRPHDPERGYEGVHHLSGRTPTRSTSAPSTTPSSRRSPGASSIPGRPWANR